MHLTSTQMWLGASSNRSLAESDSKESREMVRQQSLNSMHSIPCTSSSPLYFFIKMKERFVESVSSFPQTSYMHTAVLPSSFVRPWVIYLWTSHHRSPCFPSFFSTPADDVVRREGFLGKRSMRCCCGRCGLVCSVVMAHCWEILLGRVKW